MEGWDDLRMAVGLARLIHDDFERSGTEGGQDTTEAEGPKEQHR